MGKRNKGYINYQRTNKNPFYFQMTWQTRESKKDSTKELILIQKLRV
jgi:hypothetical protein